MSTHLSLILGGAKSGKTRLAENRAIDSGLKLVYLATATAGDGEMADRITRHRQDRAASGQQWLTVEEPLDLGAKIAEHTKPGTCLVIDCLTLWLSNCLHHKCWDEQRNTLISQLTDYGNSEANNGSDSTSRIILISNETGLGVVPMGQLSRQFVDESGLLHQEIAQLANQVTLVVAGLANELKHGSDRNHV